MTDSLTKIKLEKLFFSIYADYNDVPAQSGIISGEITGYQQISSGVSGEVGRPLITTGTQQESGYYTFQSGVALTGSVGISGEVFIPYSGIEEIQEMNQAPETIYRKVANLSKVFNMDGTVLSSGLSDYESSGDYWHFSGNSGTFRGDSAVGPVGTIFGITGFDIVTLTGYRSGISTPQTSTGIESGLLYDVYELSGIRAPDEYYETAPASIEYNLLLNSEYYGNAISLISEKDNNYFYEIQYDADEFQDLNVDGDLFLNSTYRKYNAIDEYGSGAERINFSINGISYSTGSIAYSKNQYNFPQYQVDTGFYINQGVIYTEVDIDLGDQIIYDIIYSGEKESLEIKNLNDYNNRPFSEITIPNKDIFLNGVKIYSGIDFIDNNGFYPINNSTGTTGIYFTYPRYSGSISETGVTNDFINIKHQAINPDSYVAYHNGIRQPKSKIIYHAANSDLISGVLINRQKDINYLMINGNRQEI